MVSSSRTSEEAAEEKKKGRRRRDQERSTPTSTRSPRSSSPARGISAQCRWATSRLRRCAGHSRNLPRPTKQPPPAVLVDVERDLGLSVHFGAYPCEPDATGRPS